MMDNQCVNIFSTHATVYGPHSVKFAFIEKENIFLCVSSTQFLSLVCVSLFSPPPKFSPKLVLFFLFLQGEKLVFGIFNLCSSQGELFLFPIELNCFLFHFFFIFSYFVTYVFCLSSDWVVFVNTRQKGGEIVDMWESYLFCLGGVKIVFGRGRYYVCFWQGEILCFLFHIAY